MADDEKCPHCGEVLPDDGPDDPLDDLVLDGEVFKFEKLSFKERKAIMRTVGELVKYEDEDADPDTDWTKDDMRLAFAIVCARKGNPEFSLDDGLALIPEDLDVKDPPTPPAKRSRSKASSA